MIVKSIQSIAQALGTRICLAQKPKYNVPGIGRQPECSVPVGIHQFSVDRHCQNPYRRAICKAWQQAQAVNPARHAT